MRIFFLKLWHELWGVRTRCPRSVWEKLIDDDATLSTAEQMGITPAHALSAYIRTQNSWVIATNMVEYWIRDDVNFSPQRAAAAVLELVADLDNNCGEVPLVYA